MDTAPDLTPVNTQPVTEVADAPVLAMDVLQGAGAELSLSELGLGCYTPVGLIQNLLEFMHVGIGLPWWGAIVAGKILLGSKSKCFYAAFFADFFILSFFVTQAADLRTSLNLLYTMYFTKLQCN